MQVMTPPQRAQRQALALKLGPSLTGNNLLPPTPLEHEM